MTAIPTVILSNNKFTHIIHVSDIHIKPRDRFDEYDEVFNRLYTDLNKLKAKKLNAIIVVTGDTIDNKHIFSPSTYKLCGDLFTNLSQIYPTIVILGNHDFASLTMLDSVSPVAYPRENFYFLTKSGIYNYGDVTFVLTSLYDNTYDFIKREQVQTDKLCACLYHGTIENSSTDEGIIFKNDGASTRFRKQSDLNGFDIVLLGDIHKVQEVKKNAWYSGSLIQQTFGESVNKHGYLIWNIKDRSNIKVEFKEIINDYGRVTIKIENNVWANQDIVIPKKSYIRCITTNTIEEKKNEIIEYIRKSKNTEILDISMISNDKILPTSTTIKTEDNVIIKEDIITQELKKLDKEERVKDELINLHKKYYNEITKEDISTNYLWYPIKLEFNNMFGYAKSITNKINFKQGVTSITAPNATGKTSIINILFFTIFEDLLLNPGRSKHADIINNKEKEAYVKLDIQYGTIIYTIERTIKRKTSSKQVDIHTKISYMENNKLITKEQKLANDLIKKMFGNINDYYKCNILNSRDQTNDFFRLTDMEKIKYLKQSFNLNYFDELVSKNKTDIDEIKKIVDNLETKRNIYNDEYIKITNKTFITGNFQDDAYFPAGPTGVFLNTFPYKSGYYAIYVAQF
ncbi:DNA repair exonuclease, partial [Klosneuvirus KNV1]